MGCRQRGLQTPSPCNRHGRARLAPFNLFGAPSDNDEAVGSLTTLCHQPGCRALSLGDRASAAGRALHPLLAAPAGWIRPGAAVPRSNPVPA